jgi:predicted RNA-binding Zn-ribbon protein involved in translation (DUF1610 family)
MKRPCLDCRKLFVVERPKQSRCPSCGDAHRRRTQRPRQDAEPWRALYKLREWHRTAARVRLRDVKCRAVIGGQRCQATTDLEVHHDPPLEQLWAQAGGDWALFVELATNERRLYALCRRHHAQADAIRRRRHES